MLRSMMLFLFFCILKVVQGSTIALEPDFDLISFTPKDGSTLSGREALTVVFNLAVIPLGADLGDGPLPQDYVPFVLEGTGVPGHLRWVSSSTARFDPSIDWPSDLKDITIEFNSRIRSVSGKSLRKAPKPRHFSTASLTYWARDVKSQTLEKLTDNCWSSSLEEEKFKPRNAHECPFDAQVLISFNFPVVVDRFVQDPSMFELTEGGMMFTHTLPIASIAPCPQEVPKPLHLDLGGPAVVNQSRCLSVRLPKTLETGADYRLQLRKGARYHPFAGPYAGGDSSEPIKLTGLRPFQFKFLKRHFRRELFKIYLRHGLKAPSESLQNLQRAFSVTNRVDGQVLPHQLTLKSNSTLQLKVQGLQPEEEYVISVSPRADVVDGMGLELQESKGQLKMGNLPGIFLAPEPRNPGLWTSACSDRFMPKDAPEIFPLLQRQPPLDMMSSKVDIEASMQAFVCSISSTSELGDFLTFFFQPVKDTSMAGPCSKRSFQAHPGVILAAGKHAVRFNEIPLNFPKSRLLFLELTCVGKNLGAHCASERLASRPSRTRFLNAASFSAVVAFAKPSSSPYAALGELRRTTILVSVHNLDQTAAAGYQVEIWEIPSTDWIGDRSVQPPSRRIGMESTDSHGRALFYLPEEETVGNHLRDAKGFVAVIVNPKSGEILLGDLLRLPPSPSIASQSQALAASLRLYITTDRAVYAPGDALALMGVIAALGSDCPGKKPGNMCSPTSLNAGANLCLPGHCSHSAYILAEFLWRLEQPGQQEVCSLHTWPVSPMGMFAANITVPENATLGRLPAVSIYYAKELTQVPASCSEWRRLHSQLQLPSLSAQGTPFLDILIADPRPPTAVLALGTPEFLLPGQPLTLNATLKTYTGIPLQKHELQVELTKPSKPADQRPMPVFAEPDTVSSSSEETETQSSDLVGETDSVGAWSKELHFGGEIPWVPKLEDEVTIKVKARGPTGEQLAESKKLPIRVGPWDLELRTSADTHRGDGPLPGQDFAVWMSLKAKYPQEGWKVADDKAAQLFLVDADDETTGSCSDWLRAKEKVQTLMPKVQLDSRICEPAFSPKFPGLCYFRLPRMGRFAVVAKVKLQDPKLEDHVVSTCAFLGRTTMQWRQSPLNSPNIFKRFEVQPSAASYFPGDAVKLQVWNPLAVRTRMLVIWGDRPAVTELQNVSAQETVDLGVLQDSDCPMTSCKVHVFLWSVDDSKTLIKDVPLSIHYPEGAPLWAHQEVELYIERPGPKLKVDLKPEARVIKPGGSVEIEVNIEQQEGAQTEVSMLVVDKAWLDLRPLKLQEPTKAFEPERLLSKGPQWRLASTLDGLSTASSVAKATKRIRQSLKDNQWMDYITWPLALRGSDDSMLDDEHYMDKWAEDLTDFPNSPMVAMDEVAGENFGGPMVMAKGLVPMALMAKSAPVPEMAVAADAPVGMEAASTDSSAGSPKVSLRKRFAKLVALNSALLETGVNTWKAHIRLPEDLSTYTVRVLAVSRKDGNWSWGSAETAVHTSQQVYGKPLLPRMLRFGDVCRMGAAIQATSGESPRPLVVEAMDLRNLRLLDKDKQAITMAGTSAEVRFTFAADIALGSASVIFRIKDAFGEILDMVEATIEVEQQQQGLHMASTASIQAVAGKAVVRKEAVAALKAVPGYGEMTLSASVGFQAPLLDALMEFAPTPADQPWQPQGETLLAILLGGHVLHAGYRMEASHEGLAAAISAAQARLAGQVVLKPLLGFVSAPPEHRWQVGRQEPDLLSNAYALLVLRIAESMGGAPPAWAPLNREHLVAAAGEAIRIRKATWKRCCADRISLGSFIGTWQLAIFFLGAPEAQSRPEFESLWEESQRDAIKGPEGAELDLLIRLASGQLGTALIMNFGADRRAEAAGAALLDRIRVQGPTAYFADSAESMHAASTWVQALGLWLWAGTKHAHHPFAPLVASRLLSGERCPWQLHLPARDMIMASIALLAFDSATGSSWSANMPLQIVASPSSKKLLEVTLSSTPGHLSSWTAWPWNELPPQLATGGLDLSIQVGPGSGLAVVSYGLKFMPLMPFLEPQFRGILVQKIVQRTHPSHPGRCRGKPLTAAFPGDTLCVTIQITSPDDLRDVVVIDPVPAGLEPIDEALEETPDDIGGGLFGGRPFFGRLWDREIRHDSVKWRTGFLWAGTHSLSFSCLANAPGLYSLPAAKAYSEKHVEVMGLSGAASFLVEETASTSNTVSAMQLREYRASVWRALKVNFTESSDSLAPIACPKACPPAGSCNVAKGRCECASSSGEMLPCEEVSAKVEAPFSKLLGPSKQDRTKEDFIPPHGGNLRLPEDTPKANMPSTQVVIAGLLFALLAAAIYSYVAKMKMPRNFSQPETELGSQPFTAMTDSAVRRREQPHREHGSLVQAEAEAAE